MSNIDLFKIIPRQKHKCNYIFKETSEVRTEIHIELTYDEIGIKWSPDVE